MALRRWCCCSRRLAVCRSAILTLEPYSNTSLIPWYRPERELLILGFALNGTPLRSALVAVTTRMVAVRSEGACSEKTGPIPHYCHGVLGQRDGGRLELVVLRTATDDDEQYTRDEAYTMWRELQLLLQNRVSTSPVSRESSSGKSRDDIAHPTHPSTHTPLGYTSIYTRLPNVTNTGATEGGAREVLQIVKPELIALIDLQWQPESVGMAHLLARQYRMPHVTLADKPVVFGVQEQWGLQVSWRLLTGRAGMAGGRRRR